jgi:hypothetical protein
MSGTRGIKPCVGLFLTSLLIHAEIQTQHILDSSVKAGPVEPLLHLRVRTTPQGGGVAQVRVGPIFNCEAHKRVILIGGYYYTRGKEDGAWTTTHRTFGGVDVAVWKRALELDVRSLVERHATASDYSRFRNRLRISPAGTTAPYVGVEAFVDAEGLRSMRYSAGFRRALNDELMVDIGYFYEDRRAGIGSDRHVIGTTIHWRDRSRRLDADP